MVAANSDGKFPQPIRTAPRESHIGHVTFVGSVTGDGMKGPSAYIINHVNVDPTWIQEPPSGWPPGCREGLDDIYLTSTDSGCMKHEDFSEFFKKVLIPFQKERFNSGPLLFLFDGPSVHGMYQHYLFVMLDGVSLFWQARHSYAKKKMNGNLLIIVTNNSQE